MQSFLAECNSFAKERMQFILGNAIILQENANLLQVNLTDSWGNAVLLQKHKESFELLGWILSGSPCIFSIFKYKCFAYS